MGLSALIDKGDVEGVAAYMKQHNLKLDGNTIVPADDASMAHHKHMTGFWNQRQQAR